jgi:HprK-related kinase A
MSLATRVAASGVFLRTGPFVFHVRSKMPAVTDGITLLYADHPAEDEAEFADFRVSVEPGVGLRRFWGKQAIFRCDGFRPFKPLPASQALPFLEWGMNWAIAEHAHQFLIIHAAAVERHGRVAILPGRSGSGKSTLCAALAHRGWRLLTDELTLVSLTDGAITPLVRPVSLKNQSIEVIRHFSGASVSRPSEDTAKGTVALMKPPLASVQRAGEKAPPAWIVFPTFALSQPMQLTPQSKAATFIELANNAFNYHIHGRRGFELLAAMVDRCACLSLIYNDLDAAIALFDKLTEDVRAAA